MAGQADGVVVLYESVGCDILLSGRQPLSIRVAFLREALITISVKDISCGATKVGGAGR